MCLNLKCERYKFETARSLLALWMGLTRYFQFYNEDQRQDCGKILRGDASIRSLAEELGQCHSAGV
ncbi:hypothetical protein A1353_24565 [Methylomonas methanica]|uniref:Uncharacterized protein n=1 Tax=Methylomonas methanica TaxID=421 RepID=A0A177MWP3_METMH|nr:hypothetical protein A1353_24565 [Methylomonas methanica]